MYSAITYLLLRTADETYIKNMVCDRAMVVTNQTEKLKIRATRSLSARLSWPIRRQYAPAAFGTSIAQYGFELIETKPPE